MCKIAGVKFSVVVPTFNSERFVEQALTSLFLQSHKNIELIVIDGASRDATLNILKKFSNKIDILISEPDQGQSDAFNKGFARASGDFLLWLNSDDLLAPGILSSSANYLSRNPDCKWLTFDTIFINQNADIDFCYRGSSWNEMRIAGKGPQVDCPTSIFHRDLFHNTNGFDLRLKYAMDIDLWYQFLGLGHRWHRLRQYGYAFRMHEGSKTGSKGYRAVPCDEKVSQAALIVEKHRVKKSLRAEVLANFDKLIFTKPAAYFDTLKWRGEPFSAFCE